eukprot:TRINITY_DN16312_c0_g1_i1.p1 TRINITY_DN16312_c0_g1~~TRINITY_DN16312_c0_g1_i1.p1  ORF type:complete len:247 (-),score=19.39 TRINITY_DN16312_c0_g1_i1:431-1171(-)
MDEVVQSVQLAVQEILQLLTVCLQSILKGEIPPMDVLSLLLSKGLGYAILVGASVVKIPQILAILSSGSAEGLSALSFELELLGYTIGASYGYLKNLPINTYGEAIAIWIQNVLLLFMVYNYSNASYIRRATTFGILTAFVTAVGQGAVSIAMIDTLLAGSVLIFVAARVPQIITNFRNGGTGQLSSVSVLMLLGGSLARIFTSIREDVGSQMVFSYAVGAVLNFTLLGQILFYKFFTQSQKLKTQ